MSEPKKPLSTDENSAEIVSVPEVTESQTGGEQTAENSKKEEKQSMAMATAKNAKKNNRTSVTHEEPQAESESAANTANAAKTADTAKANKAGSAKDPQPVVIKKGGSGMALLALLIALAVGGAGYYFGQQQLDQIQQKLTALQGQEKQIEGTVIELPTFEQERAQLERLSQDYLSAQQKIASLERDNGLKAEALGNLQAQINKLNNSNKTDNNDWLLSEADFLLNNGLRKLVLDHDVDTTISLLKLADETLEKVSDAQVIPVRSAINQDLKQLLAVNNVDQNAIMQRLSQLANKLDELTVLNVNFDDDVALEAPTDSLDDWQSNVEKSAVSFLNYFIRITPRGNADKALLAPNQDVYLRENIRLRLQIAILAVPREQDDLYKQSLEAVASWVRSYFDTKAPETESYLKELDELTELSVYVDTPDQLTSLNALDKLLNRQPHEVRKVEINADKALTEEPVAPLVKEESKPEQTPAPEAEPNTNNSETAPTLPAEQQ